MTEPRRGLLLCHGTPKRVDGGVLPADDSYAGLGDALADATGWAVVTLGLTSPTEKWLSDMRGAVDELSVRDDIAGVWLAGFGVSGGVALCLAADDDRVRGVAALAAPAEFDEWLVDAPVQPLMSISKIAPRPVLLVHGDHDDVVSSADGRVLADAGGIDVELRILTGAAHGLRHDPRAIAVLEGWLDRQGV